MTVNSILSERLILIKALFTNRGYTLPTNVEPYILWIYTEADFSKVWIMYDRPTVGIELLRLSVPASGAITTDAPPGTLTLGYCSAVFDDAARYERNSWDTHKTQYPNFIYGELPSLVKYDSLMARWKKAIMSRSDFLADATNMRVCSDLDLIKKWMDEYVGVTLTQTTGIEYRLMGWDVTNLKVAALVMWNGGDGKVFRTTEGVEDDQVNLDNRFAPLVLSEVSKAYENEAGFLDPQVRPFSMIEDAWIRLGAAWKTPGSTALTW